MFTDEDIRSEYNENYRYARDYWAPFVKDAQVYTLAASGYTWSDDERKALIKEGREPYELNIMRRPQQFFSGYLRDNINEIIYGPVEGSDQATADQFTKLSYYVWDKGQGYQKFLDSADEGIKSGISLCGIQMDYSRDFVNGDISFYNRTYNSFYLDPTFSDINLSDCSFGITRDLVSKDYTKQLIPMVDPSVIDDIQSSYRDDKFMQYHPEFQTFSRNRNLLAYDQYYRRITRERTFLYDNGNGFYRDITDMSAEDRKKLKAGIGRLRTMRYEAEEMGMRPEDVPDVEIKTAERPFVELNIMLNGQRVYNGEDPTGISHTYPFVPNICYFEPSIWMPSQRIQGLSSCNWSLQRQFNMRHMKIVDMMDSTISTGFKYLIGSVADPQDMQQSGQNKLIGVDPENAPEGLNSVQELNGGTASPALLEYQKVLNDLSLTLANVNESTLGIDQGGNTQISGRLAEVRIAQGLRGNRKMMDNIEYAQQVLGGLVLTCLQKKYSPGKIKRILGEEPTEQFYSNEFEQYDAIVKEGVKSKSQRDAYYYELVNLKKDGIVDVPQAEIVNALAMSGLSDLKKAIEAQEEQRSQEKAKIAEAEQLKIDLGNAQREQMLALAQERRARVIADVGLANERASEAEQNRAKAALDRAKTMTEIQNMTTDQFIRVGEFVAMMERQESIDRDNLTAQINQTADQINSETAGSEENLNRNALSAEMVDQENTMNAFNQGG